MEKHDGDTSLIALLGLSVVIVGVAGTIGLWLIRDISANLISAALTNIAQVGGIISGLSLSGTAVLTLNGRFSFKILQHYGSAIRFVLFGGFSILITVSLLAAVAVLWEGGAFSRAVLSYGTPAMFVILVATALLINSAFAWDRTPKKPTGYNPLA